MDTHECKVGKQRRNDKALLYEATRGQRYKRRNSVKIQKLDNFSEIFKEK
jgi:hypothetical protein